MNSPGLLVSVRSAAEARVALACGVDLIDIKEPRLGSLGACDASTIAEIADVVGDRCPLSVALGELRDFFASGSRLPAERIRFAKFGLAGMGDVADWQARFSAALKTLPARVKSVAVIYVDYRQAKAPPPQAVIEAGVQSRCGALLVDTFCKDGTTLLDHCSTGELRQWGHQARAAKMTFVVAGSVNRELIPRLARCRVDYIAVRGAACKDSRASEIDAGRIAEIAQLVSASRRPQQSLRV
jgi:(5-formylfuran-3-yl)methyl phosphate synthase